MPTQQKAAQIEEIKERFQEASAVLLVDFRGMTVKQTEKMRRDLAEVGASMKVYKNTLATIALRELELPEMPEYLAGPTAFVLGGADAAAAAKVVKNTAADTKILQIKGGLMGQNVLSVDDVKALAELPSHDELVAKLLGTLQNPIAQFVRVLQGPAESFARVLGAIAETKDAA